MKSSYLIASFALAACSHTKQVESPASDPAATKSTVVDKTSIPLASDPLQMLTPDGRNQLRVSLRKRDLLPEKGSVSSALRTFQKQEGLPETGMPDDETLIKLNLDPKKVSIRVNPSS